MRKMMMTLLLVGVSLAGTARVAVPVDGVTGATQVTSYRDKRQIDDRRVSKGMERMRKALPRVQGARVETAVVMSGRTMAQSGKWKGELPSLDKMKAGKSTTYKSTTEGHNNMHTYQFLTLPGAQLCAVRITPLGGCIYFSAQAGTAEDMMSLVHEHVVPALEATLCGKSAKNIK